jgi:hypothetical protein
MANLDQYPAVLDVVFAYHWKHLGDLKWIRTTSPSPWLEKQGINSVVAFVPESAGKGLPDDLLALYWNCRTSLPVYPRIKQVWEVWNEPDFHFVAENPDRMAAVLKAAYWGIKAGNSNASVVMPSLAFNPNKYGIALAKNNIYPYTEGYNCHYYGWAHDFLPSLEQHRRFLRDQGWRLPLWITEAGYFLMRTKEANDPVELARQQAFHERLAISAYASGVDYYLPYILTPATEEGADLSLATDAFSPRPSLDSYLYLTRHLPRTMPLYQILHRSTGREIGVVLQEASGNWLTVLWTLHRLHDFSLPLEEQTNKTLLDYGTTMQLGFSFPRSVNQVDIGLKPENAKAITRSLQQSSWNRFGLRLAVSAESNIFLRTPPVRFRIGDCFWRKIWPDSEAEPGITLDLAGSGNTRSTKTAATLRARVVGQKATADKLTTVSASMTVGTATKSEHLGNDDVFLNRAASDLDSDLRSDEAKPQCSRTDLEYSIASPTLPPGKTGRGRNRRAVSFDPNLKGGGLLKMLANRWESKPCPVVLQIDYDRSAFARNKPSQTYRYEPGTALSANLNIYNFSEEPQRGAIRVVMPSRWRVFEVKHTEVASYEPISKSEIERPEQRLRRVPFAKRISIPALSTVSLALRFVDPDLESRTESTTPQSRTTVDILWKGKDGTKDYCLTSIESILPPPETNIPFVLGDWSPTLEQPSQWQMEIVGEDTMRFVLREENLRSGIASLYLPVPNDLRLCADDMLRMAMRLSPASSGAYYRINFLTPQREVFRYSETSKFDQGWTEISYRLGDFSPFFWSRVGKSCKIPVQRFRILRISLGNLQVGDALELRNPGIWRPR